MHRNATEQSWDINDFDMREVNTSGIYLTGNTYKTNEGDEITIVGQSTHKRWKTVSGKQYPYYERVVIQFPEGHYTDVYIDSVRRGKIKNHMRKNTCGVGRIGIGDAPVMINKTHSPQFIKWSGLITRCHNEIRLEKRPEYSDCTIEEDWYDYQNFYRDIQTLPGYTEWISGAPNYELDKDARVLGNRHYSKDTCTLMPRRLNSMITAMKGRGYVQTDQGKFSSTTGSFGKRDYVGTFNTEYEARMAYLREKRRHTLIILEEETNNINEEVYVIIKNYIKKWFILEMEDNEVNGSRVIYANQYTATRISDGRKEDFVIIKDFANKYSLEASSVSRCCAGLQAYHKDWTFELKQKARLKETQK